MPSSLLRVHSSKLPRKHGLASPFQRLNIPTAFRLYVRMLGSASQRIGKFRKQAQSYFTTIYQGELNNPQNPLNDYTLSIYGTTNTPRQDRSGFQRSPSQRFIGICWKVRRQGRVVDGFRGTKTGSRCFQNFQHGLNSQQLLYHSNTPPHSRQHPSFPKRRSKPAIAPISLPFASDQVICSGIAPAERIKRPSITFCKQKWSAVKECSLGWTL